MKTIATHNAKFHTDDVFATAVILLYLEKKGQEGRVVRTWDKLVWEKADFVHDVGFIYNPKKNRFDHHQQGGAEKRENGIPYASFGLVWKKFGKIISGGEKAAKIVDERLICAIDARDNGVETYELLFPDISLATISQYVEGEANVIGSRIYKEKSDAHKALDVKFRELVEWAKNVILVYIENAKTTVKAEKVAIKLYNSAKDKRVMIMKQFIPYSFGNFPEPLLLIYPDLRTESRWCVKTVGEKNNKLKNRILFPESWRGKIDEDVQKASGVATARFCHKAGFLASAETKEGALELARKALEQV